MTSKPFSRSARIRTLAAALALSAGLGPALAKPPSPDDRPSLETIRQQAKVALQRELEQAEAERRDPVGEAIENYRQALVPLNEYRQVVDVLLNDKDEDVQPYRKRAKDALKERFKKQENDPDALVVRREIGLELCKLMKATKDDEGVALVADLFFNFWRGQMVKLRFKPDDSKRSRSKAYSRMKRFLEKDGK